MAVGRVLDFLFSLLIDTPLPSLRDEDGEVRLLWIVVAIAVPFFAVATLIFAALMLAGGR